MSTPLLNNERLKRLYYLSMHRGCKETDFILGKFAEHHLNSLSSEELDYYETFLEQDDWDIYAWTTGKKPIPTELDHPLFKKIMDGIHS